MNTVEETKTYSSSGFKLVLVLAKNLYEASAIAGYRCPPSSGSSMGRVGESQAYGVGVGVGVGSRGARQGGGGGGVTIKREEEMCVSFSVCVRKMKRRKRRKKRRSQRRVMVYMRKPWIKVSLRT